MKKLLVVSHAATAQLDERIIELAEWMGVPAKKVTVQGGADLPDRMMEEAGSGEYCVAVAAETLTLMADAPESGGVREFFFNQSGQLLIVACGDRSAANSAIEWMSDDHLSLRDSSRGRQTFRFPEAGREVSRQFAGLGFSGLRGRPIPAVRIADQSSFHTTPIMLADEAPAFVRTIRGSCELFVLSVSGIPDINTFLSHDKRVEELYDQLIPLLLFLRYCFESTFWHPRTNTARLIIDDPLLAYRYGFLDYNVLARSMRESAYGTTIAFIPWNHWRTSKREAERFLKTGPGLSICVHGCDHSNKEFGAVDPIELQWKAGTALVRMENHEARTGVPFERVMVFPQGWFSTPAIAALRASNYLAAVNTTCFPTDEGSSNLTIADFLRPAVMRFDGLPVFQRRYPKRLVDCAFDLFLGRPALLVEHHQYFQNGYENLEDFVRGLYKIEPSLSWSMLSSQLTECCVTRTASDGGVDIEFYTRKFRFKNTDATPKRLSLAKVEPHAERISNVLVGGRSAPFSFRKNSIVLDVEAGPGKTVNVEIVDHPGSSTSTHRPGLKYSIGVPVRRALSEFRDNTLARHPRVLEAATGLARKLKATADHDREDVA